MDETRFRTILDGIRSDRGHGAAALARAALDALADSAETMPAADVAALSTGLEQRAAALEAARPAMAPLAHLIDRWRAEALPLPDDPAAARAAAAVAARHLRDLSATAGRAAARHCADRLPDDAAILTHSLSETVMTAFALAAEAGKHLHVMASESRPLYEGREVAERVAAQGHTVTVVTDAQLGLFAHRAGIAVTGADSLLPDGSVVNKAGTLLLALGAREAGIPFWVCCESFKRRPRRLGKPVLESADSAELGWQAAEGIATANVYFDITPGRLIGRLITEDD